MLIEQPELPAAMLREIDGGYMEGFETPQGFQMQRLCCTDPAMYLRHDLSPGSFYKG